MQDPDSSAATRATAPAEAAEAAGVDRGGADAARVSRALGAALGAAPGPVAAYAQGWAGTGDGGAHVWLLATLAGALLGALTLPLFAAPRATWASPAEAAKALGVGFSALFAFAVGLVAGAFAGFPMGSVMGALGGALAGAVVALVVRALGARRFGVVIAWAVGAGAALLAVWAWFQ